MIRASLTVCAVLAAAIGGVSSAAVLKDAPGCTLPEVEKCGLDFIPFFVSPRLAETAKDLDKDCKVFKGQLQCLQNFGNKCLEGLGRGIVSLMLGATTEEYGSLCNTTNAKHKEYLDSVKCINKAGPQVQTCTQDFLVALHRAATAPANKQIAYSCCDYLDFVECTTKGLTSNCNLPTAIKFFNLIVEKIVGEGLDLACGKYKKGTNTCQALPALSKKNDNNYRGKGFVEPLITIVGNFG